MFQGEKDDFGDYEGKGKDVRNMLSGLRKPFYFCRLLLKGDPNCSRKVVPKQ